MSSFFILRLLQVFVEKNDKKRRAVHREKNRRIPVKPRNLFVRIKPSLVNSLGIEFVEDFPRLFPVVGSFRVPWCVAKR